MKVLVADRISKEGIDILQRQAQVDVKVGLKPEEIIAIIGGYEGLVVRSQTRGLINAEELSLVKPTVRIINCARGGLVNEEALLVLALDEPLSEKRRRQILSLPEVFTVKQVKL
ncbi:MAG: NAD(P)-dependent oxidoreductase [Dehalococcoidales bacterium]